MGRLNFCFWIGADNFLGFPWLADRSLGSDQFFGLPMFGIGEVGGIAALSGGKVLQVVVVENGGGVGIVGLKGVCGCGDAGDSLCSSFADRFHFNGNFFEGGGVVGEL